MANITVTTSGGASTLVSIGSRGPAGPAGTGGGGGVTSVATGTGLTGGPVTTTGTIALANTAVTAASYTNADITVDAQGRITAAANGSTAGTVTGTAPIDVTSGVISLSTTLPSDYEFTSPTRPTSSGSGTPTATSLITAADGDTRYGRDFIQIISTAVEAFSTAFVNGPDLVLPAGTYDFEILALIESASETAGGQSNFRCSPSTDVTTGIETRFVNVAALGTGGTAGTSFRKGSNQLGSPDFFAACYFDAPNNFASVTTRGTTVLVSETTVSFRIKQRSATDAVNATKIAVGSFIKFTKR